MFSTNVPPSGNYCLLLLIITIGCSYERLQVICGARALKSWNTEQRKLWMSIFCKISSMNFWSFNCYEAFHHSTKKKFLVITLSSLRMKGSFNLYIELPEAPWPKPGILISFITFSPRILISFIWFVSAFWLEDGKKVQSIGSANSLPIKHNIEPLLLLVPILQYKYN